MELRSLPAAEPAVRRYVEALWLPYHRELERIVDGHALAEDVDVVAEEVAYRLDRLVDEAYRTWVAVEGPDGGDRVEEALADAEGDLAGFVTTEVRTAPTVFDHPDRLIVGDIYVREAFRGTGLAGDLMDCAAKRAREAGCSELALDVDVDNDRAIAFYESLGFETCRQRMTLDVREA